MIVYMAKYRAVVIKKATGEIKAKEQRTYVKITKSQIKEFIYN